MLGLRIKDGRGKTDERAIPKIVNRQIKKGRTKIKTKTNKMAAKRTRFLYSFWGCGGREPYQTKNFWNIWEQYEIWKEVKYRKSK